MWYTHVRLGYWSWKEDISTEDIQNYMNDLADEGYAISTIEKQYTRKCIRIESRA